MPEPSTELPSGHRIGRYVVRRRLGAGGFARVYLAWDPDLEIEVAIKIPKPELADDAEALDRFRREATTAARLRHPNVVTVLTVGRLDEPFDGAPVGAPYLVMDYLPESLSSRLAATPILPEPEWILIGEEVARGLAYAHAQGVVHRDVKPDNILFGRHGEAVVTDFGIARAVSARLAPTSRSIVVGTPEYFSPEQARGLPLDGRTDIYALGVTLYRMATGALPFLGEDWYAIMRQHVEEPPPPPRTLNPELSAAAEAVILQCLVKMPEERFQGAAELATALATAAHPAAAVVDASHPPLDGATIDMAVLPGRRRHPAHRRRAIALGAAALVAAGTAVAAVALHDRTPPQAPRLDVPPAVAQPLPPAAATPTDSAPAAAPTPIVPTPPPAAVAARAAIRVVAPANALIAVDGRSVGSGGWRSESLTIGRHEVRASIPSGDGCASASKTQVLDLARGEQRIVRLQPVPCGSLSILVTPAVPAHYTLTADGGQPFEGSLPLSRPVVLPEGEYHLAIEAPGCAPYDASVRVSATAVSARKSVHLICP